VLIESSDILEHDKLAANQQNYQAKES